ncbi:unnamed protein product, partial [Polarella glacialis]
KTRRFASATRVPESLPNRFASELRYFLMPLVARWQQPDQGCARWATSEATLVAALLRCLGVLLECAGCASPDRDAAASECLAVSSEALTHADPHVRRCSLFLLSRVLLVGCELMVFERPEILSELEASPFREGDETCRRMAAGILACLSKYTLL